MMSKVTLETSERLWGDLDRIIRPERRVTRKAYKAQQHGALHVFQHDMPSPQELRKPPHNQPEILSSWTTAYVHWFTGEFGDLDDWDDDNPCPVAVSTTFRHQRRGWVYGWHCNNSVPPGCSPTIN